MNGLRRVGKEERRECAGGEQGAVEEVVERSGYKELVRQAGEGGGKCQRRKWRGGRE